MDRIERLEHSFMEPPDWEEPMTAVEIVPPPQIPMPDDDAARRQMVSAICGNRDFRWLVEIQLGLDEARKRYPEAYLIVK